MAQGLFIGLPSDTLWASEQVLSLMCATAPVGICLWTAPEVCTLVGVCGGKGELGLCLLRVVTLEITVDGKKEDI